VVGKLPALHSRRSILISLALLFAAVFFLPYLSPVPSAISLSCLFGYDNRTAFQLFAFGSLLFALLVRQYLREIDATDESLGLPSLFLSLAVALAGCAIRILPISRHLIGGEAAYALNRIQMLASGHRPYLDFEFAYGPANLYIPVLLARLPRSSVIGAYYLWWIIQWMAGTAMLWVTIRLIALPLPRRRLLFWLIFAIQLPGILYEGTAYTPTRTIGSAFFVVLVTSIWEKTRWPLTTAASAILCVALAFAISPDQGIAVCAGLLIWFVLLGTQRPSPFPLRAAVAFTCGAVLIGLICWRVGEFSTLIDFSGGAFAFPLLPSPTNIVILIAYVAAACVAVRALLARSFDSSVLPLFFAGFALLPAAMGRCDVGHILIASPAWLVGAAAIESRPSLRRWWSPLAILFVIAPILAVSLASCMSHLHQTFAPLSQRRSEPDPATFASAVGSCPVVYRTLNVAPKPSQTSLEDCLDTGRYDNMVNAFTPNAIDIMLRDLNRRPLQPLVLLDAPLARQIQPTEVSPNVLRLLEFSPWLPQPRNQPLTYQALIDSIERNYVPAPTPTGPFRVWYPKPPSVP
jgi:hypothetical protein